MRVQLSVLFAVAVLLLAVPSALAQTPAPRTGPPPQRMHAGLLAARNASATPLQVQLNAGFPQIVAGRFAVDGATPGARARAFVSTFARMYGQGLDRDLRISLRRATGAGAVLGQTYKGVPVHGARLSIATAGKTVFGSVGRLATDLRLDPSPQLTAAAAENRLRTALGRPNERLLGEPRVVIFVPDLLRMPAGPPRPAYQLVLAGEPPIRALVDGNTGDVLLQEPLEHEAYTMSLFDANQTKPAKGECYVDTAGNTLAATHSGVQGAYAGDSDVTTARAALANAYSLFRNKLGRKSYDGLDSRLLGYVHANTGNARWSSSCHDMAARDGVVTNDVWLHELAHGVTQFTSGLVYHNQSGALNESFSDTMAAASDNDWLIDGGSLGVIRDMSDPVAYGHPGHWLDYLSLPDTKPGDWGGVHSNSGIPNKARQLMADGGTYPGEPRKTFPVNGFGRTKMAKVAYLGNQMIDASGDFQDAAGIELIASTLVAVLQPGYGIAVADLCTIRNAWAAVGVATALGDNDCDGKADGSDGDIDGDGIPNAYDNCPDRKSNNLNDRDGDDAGDVCDPDDDNDGVVDAVDNCVKFNPDQADINANGKGDVCEDYDLDGVFDDKDNCLVDHNPGQIDSDGDGEGDACEVDADGDGVNDDDDKCQFVPGGSADKDADGLGDACDPCPSGADVVIAYTSGNKQIGSKPKPILKDSDGDGTPDGCEKLSGQGLFASSGDRLRRAVAIRPGGRRALIVRGRRGTRFTTIVPPCTGRPCAELLDRGALFQIAITGLRSGIGVRLVDDLGNNVAASRGLRGGRLVLRFRPQADRRYLLEGLVQSRLPPRGDRFSVKVSPARG